MIVLTTLKQKATAATIQILKCCGLSLLLTGLPYYLENLFDQFSKVLLAVDKLHTVLQSTLDCRLSLGGLNQIQKMFYKWFIFSLFTLHQGFANACAGRFDLYFDEERMYFTKYPNHEIFKTIYVATIYIITQNM